MYRRFGSRVTVIESADRLIAREDPDVSREVQAMLEREGIEFHLSVRCAKVSRRPRRLAHPHRAERRRRRARGRRHAPAGRDRPASEHRRPRPGARRHRHRCARFHHRRRAAAHQRARRVGAGRRERPRRLHAHRVQRPRDRRRQPARRRGTPRQRPHHGLRAVHRPAAGPRRHERGRGPRQRPPGAGRPAADDPRRPCPGTRRDAGLHEGAGGRGDRAHPRCVAAVHRRRRDRALAARGDGRRAVCTGRSSARCTSTRPSAS